MIMYISHSHNFNDKSNNRYYTVCGLVVDSNDEINTVFKKAGEMIKKSKIINADSVSFTLDPNALENNKYTIPIKNYILSSMPSKCQIISCSKKISDSITEEQMIQKWFPKMVMHIISKKNFIEQCTAIKVLKILEGKSLIEKVKKKYNVELEFIEKNTNDGLKISDNFCSVIRKTHCNNENVKGFYGLITSNYKNVINEILS